MLAEFFFSSEFEFQLYLVNFKGLIKSFIINQSYWRALCICQLFNKRCPVFNENFVALPHKWIHNKGLFMKSNYYRSNFHILKRNFLQYISQVKLI